MTRAGTCDIGAFEFVAAAHTARAGSAHSAVTGSRLKAPIDLRGLPKGTFKVRVTVRTADGRSATLTRTYRTCAPKRKR